MVGAEGIVQYVDRRRRVEGRRHIYDVPQGGPQLRVVPERYTTFCGDHRRRILSRARRSETLFGRLVHRGLIVHVFESEVDHFPCLWAFWL
jgi:hypothetical protein